jgi:hypothetical protein
LNLLRCVAATFLVLMLSSCETRVGAVATEQEFSRWLAADRGRAERFARFEATLRTADVSDVVPPYDLWMMDRLRQSCTRALFVEPPEESWTNILATLRFIRDQVEPAIGEVRVVSAYRDETFNVCVGGAPASAHRGFYAVDVIPMDRRITRATLIDRLCRIHEREGPSREVGLGIYRARRFHIDTRSYRGWGHDHRGVSFPCTNAAMR